MKKIICICASAMMLGSGALYAQGEMDAYKFSQRDLNGTARYLGMGGAFGALGGDISAMETNPAGLGIYRSSEIVTTLSLSTINTNTNWFNTKMDGSKTRFNFDNIAYVGYFPTGNDEGIVSWNVGFSYNRVKNFNRTYNMGRGSGGISISDYIANYANISKNYETNQPLTGQDLWSTDKYNPYLSQDWLPTLAYNSGMLDYYNNSFHSSFIDENDKPLTVETADLKVHERGAIDKYNFSVAANISNVVFLGATINVTDMNYRINAYYDETFSKSTPTQTDFQNSLLWNNYRKTTGTGYGVNVGVIVRPADFIRFGVAYNSPTWYKLTTRYQAVSETYVYGYYSKIENPIDPGNTNLAWKAETPLDFYTDYKLNSADRWIFSAAAVLGKTALLSVDYELNGYKNMRLKNRDGVNQTLDNDDIKLDFRYSSTFKVGAEIKLTPQFAVRAGASFQNSPFQDHMMYSPDGAITDVYPTGTLTTYTVDKHINHYTFGLGYRFTPNFYVDLAYVYKEQKEEAYPFSNLVYDKQVIVESIPATLKTKTNKVALTLGYKF